MVMKSKDLIQQQLKDNLVQAFKSDDENAIAQAFSGFAESVQQNVMDEFNAYQQTADKTILAKRGVHQLTADESKFYQSIIGAMKSNNPRQAFTDLDIAFPETVIDNVIADIKTAHPLLDAISFTNTTILTKIILNKQGAQLATWGPLNSAIAKELEGAIGKIDLTICKLSAFMPIAKDMLEAGPSWIDAYVRSTLSEAIALALETSIITGTGNNEPIGMDRSVADNVTVTGGVYPQKTPLVITDLEVVTYGSLLGMLSQAPNGKTRPVNSVLLVVNPKDYFTKVMPATTIRALDGTYTRDVFPFPTTVEQSSAVEEGKAIIGLASKYFMGIGAGTNGGKIEYSDEFRFLDDERVYITKLYGNGRALDDNAFILLDISKLTPATLKVIIEDALRSLTVTSEAGTTSGKTKITVSPSLTDGNTYKYKTGANLTIPVFNQVLTTGWTTWDGIAEITATTGNRIVIAEVDASNQAKAIGEATVTSMA
ncbi:phage major capsid protein [Clostridium pasteurianum]|uniref:Phage capsid family protein n=1 Tax=Clostridium pasteurianum BC1 TaxID=86416 RepID=R4JYM7_CLOPA|nr:phage major capsid protein [Clostridium pasteurianum]AGK95403.1 phage capsid family protein [Clostridium pasteurianum BC1]